MAEKLTPAMNMIRRRTFQEATKGNKRTINDIEEELQDAFSVTDSVRDDVISKMNSIMHQATTTLTDTAVKFWVHTAPPSEKNTHIHDELLDNDGYLDSELEETLTEEDSESSAKEASRMWLDIITDERKVAMSQREKLSDGMGLDYASARDLSGSQFRGEGRYAALGGAYIRFLPETLTDEQKKELDLLTDSWDAFLSVYNSLVLKYKGLLQENGSVLIPGGKLIKGKSDSGDAVWDDFMDTRKVRNQTLRYVMRNLKMFKKYYSKMAKKQVSQMQRNGNVANELANTVSRTAMKEVVKTQRINPIPSVISNAPKRMFYVQPRGRKQDLVQFQGIVPTFSLQPDTGKFRIIMNVLDARFTMEAAMKTGICWSQFGGAFEYELRLRKFRVNTGVLKFVFGINPGWIEQGKNFLNETLQDGTNADVMTDNTPW